MRAPGRLGQNDQQVPKNDLRCDVFILFVGRSELVQTVQKCLIDLEAEEVVAGVVEIGTTTLMAPGAVEEEAIKEEGVAVVDTAGEIRAVATSAPLWARSVGVRMTLLQTTLARCWLRG